MKCVSEGPVAVDVCGDLRSDIGVPIYLTGTKGACISQDTNWIQFKYQNVACSEMTSFG